MTEFNGVTKIQNIELDSFKDFTHIVSVGFVYPKKYDGERRKNEFYGFDHGKSASAFAAAFLRGEKRNELIPKNQSIQVHVNIWTVQVFGTFPLM